MWEERNKKILYWHRLGPDFALKSIIWSSTDVTFVDYVDPFGIGIAPKKVTKKSLANPLYCASDSSGVIFSILTG
jgi:hypothetical protein